MPLDGCGNEIWGKFGASGDGGDGLVPLDNEELFGELDLDFGFGCC